MRQHLAFLSTHRISMVLNPGRKEEEKKPTNGHNAPDHDFFDTMKP